jgi:competence protein ComEC
MGQGTTAFLLGILVFQQLTVLPPAGWAALMPVCAALGWRWSLLRPPAWLACGFLWALLHAHAVLDAGLPAGLEGKDVTIEGTIAGIPQNRPGLVRLEVEVERLVHDGREWPSPGRIRLNWYDDAPALFAGERWRLNVRLRRPHGFANPGGLDFEGHLYRRGIRATGYVRKDARNARLAVTAAHPLQRLRQALGRRIAEALPGAELGGVVTALAIGDQQGIGAKQWDVFRRTGTGHLVAISGMHVALVAGLCFVVLRWLWSKSPRLTLACPAPCAAAVAALAGALAYAALAGLSVPTQRAVVMVAASLAALLFGRRRALGQALTAALLAVLLYDPMAVMDPGAWLSFGAVAAILFGTRGRLRASGWWRRWGALHVAVFVGLMPAMLLLFRQLPLVSPLANFIAVPCIDALIVPLILLGCLLLAVAPAAGGCLLWLAERLLSLLWPALEWLGRSDTLQWYQHTPAGWTVALAAVGVALLLAPRGLPGRWLGPCWLAPAFLLAPAPPAEGGFVFTLLDVGQGLAAVVRTHGHVVVFDTGARFGPEFDAGAAVVVPYLRHLGIRRVDLLVLSHGDNDHVGGAESLAGALRIDRVTTSAPHKVSWTRAARCRAGDGWSWDGVRFELLHPPAEEAFEGNDASCVLRVGNAGGRVLLTGDIQAAAELALVRRYGGDGLGAHILVAPHHGSKTSSTPAFVAAVHPDYVVFPVGYRNRWGFPRPEVLGRYRARHVRAFDTAEHGAIVFEVPAAGGVGPPVSYRRLRARYWHEGR